MKIKLTDIFISNSDKWHFSKQVLLALEIKQNFIDEIARRLALTYFENGSKESNVCFLNDEQLRPEYKMFFSKSDVINYLNWVLKADDFDLKNDEVPFPEVGEFFIKK